MLKGKRLEICLAVAVTFAVILASGVIFPNPFMPAMVRQAHFFELSSSMLVFGAIAGWVWKRLAKDHR
jgi:fucose permease